MPKLLSLFIRQPADWQLARSFGDIVDGRAQAFTLLRTAGDGPVYAAAEGWLSARPPGVAFQQHVEIEQSGAQRPSGPVTLYLHLTPLAYVFPSFEKCTKRIGGGLRGFAYIGVEAASLEDSLSELLDAAAIPAGQIPRNDLVGLLLCGAIDVRVSAGHVIGKACGPDAQQTIGFSFFTDLGPIDPSFGYDVLREFVTDSQDQIDALFALMPKKWPLFHADLPPRAAIDMTAVSLYSWAVLKDLERAKQLTSSEWREVGDNQKRLWRDRLLSRVGHAPDGSTSPPFEFNDFDWRNLFQLEAVVEFFANFSDPLVADSQPADPLSANYLTVSFLCPRGIAATLTGSVMTLEGSAFPLELAGQELSRLDGLILGKDTVTLKDDLVRRNGRYRILQVNGLQLTLDAEPLMVPDSTAWAVSRRPILVLIDSFGPRIRGSGAQVSVSGAQSVIAFMDNPDLSGIRDNFDTVLLPSDTARKSRTYRIIAHDATTVTVQGTPVLSGGESRWQVPAGIDGQLEFLQLVPGGDAGDQYDGRLFVVYGDEVRQAYRFSSYSSRSWGPNNASYRSSVRGNARYYFQGYFSSGSRSRNYSFKVVDRFIPNDPDAQEYDHIREARFYNGDPVTNDADGKESVRIHKGRGDRNDLDNPDADNNPWVNGGSGSAGCLVSPLYEDLRDLLVQLYLEEQAELTGQADREVAKLRDIRHENRHFGLNLWQNTHANANALPTNPHDPALSEQLEGEDWRGKVSGVLWVIRPDERPLGSVQAEVWR